MTVFQTIYKSMWTFASSDTHLVGKCCYLCYTCMPQSCMLCCLHLAAVAEMVVTIASTAVIAVQNKALRNVFGSKWWK